MVEFLEKEECNFASCLMGFLFLLLGLQSVVEEAHINSAAIYSENQASRRRDAVAGISEVIRKTIEAAAEAEKEVSEEQTAEVIPDDNLLCFLATTEIEKEYGIEKHLLSTIASIESGRWDYEREQYMAWPWTVNAQGKGYYLKTKEEAIAKVKELQAEGIESIDVGCMQINLMYHSEAFSSLEDAFDPHKNVEYGATFLSKLYSTRGEDWDRAVMAYHSKDPERGEKYRMRLTSRYEQLKIAFNSSEFKWF